MSIKPLNKKTIMNETNSFVNLPHEIHWHILSFIGDPTFSYNISYTTKAKQVLNFQSTCRKLMYNENCHCDDKDYFNEFYWKLLENYLPIHFSLLNEFNNYKIELIKKGNLKRIILLTLYIKYKLKKNNDTETIICCLLGERGVGKTSILVRFIRNTFIGIYDPSFLDDTSKIMNVNDSSCKIEILDTHGDDEYTVMSDYYISRSQFVVLVCDLRNFKSIEILNHKIEQVLRIKDSVHIPIIFVLNKMDLIKGSNDELDIIEKFKNGINKLIEDFGLINSRIVITSAKTGDEIESIFEAGIELLRLEMFKQVIEKDVKYLKYVLSMSRIGKEKKCLTM